MWPRCDQGLSSGCVRSALVRSSQQLQLAVPAFSENFSFGEENDHRDWEPEETVTTAPKPPKPPKFPKWPKARYSNAALTLMQAKQRSFQKSQTKKPWKSANIMKNETSGCAGSRVQLYIGSDAFYALPTNAVASLRKWLGRVNTDFDMKISKAFHLPYIIICVQSAFCFFASHSRHSATRGALHQSYAALWIWWATEKTVKNWDLHDFHDFQFLRFFKVANHGKSILPYFFRMAWIMICSDRRAPPSCNAQRGEPFAIFAEAERLQRFSQWVIFVSLWSCELCEFFYILYNLNLFFECAKLIEI